ncbi:MAG TPA: gluconate 2-dehydrogenase subunit 3 family protein, partial [Longimicrobiales bacterium]
MVPPEAHLLTRREALKRAALLLGGTLSASTVAGVLAGCDRPRGAAMARLATLSRQQNDLVSTIAEIIIPETDTPGARAARVNEFIDAMLGSYYPDEEREAFLAGLERVDAHAQRLYGSPFLECTPEQQVEMIAALDREAFGGPAGGTQVAAADDVAAQGTDPELLAFYRRMKELTLVGYYTSEVGATQELRVNPMGVYRGDIPYAEVGRAWA